MTKKLGLDTSINLRFGQGYRSKRREEIPWGGVATKGMTMNT
ncbi:hypothetical protein [Paenibacillus polymyxa]|nr:hypothetical protein [Paenibacillus polymyxa]MDN4106410.1 hypothetical protein [Paenibacillus polymyxa]